MPTSAAPKMSASGSLLTASTVPALRTPTAWLNLPLAPTARYRRGEMECPVIPTWRARGSQPWSVTLRVAASSASSRAFSGSSFG